jgi:MFS transporter, FSR family, fosmidomycin resistance protein
VSSPSAVPPPARDASVIATIGFTHGTSHFFHLMLPSLFPWLMPAFGLSFTEVGTLMTIFFIVSGVGQALSGFLVDRLGAARVLFAAIGMFTASGVVAAAAQSYPMLVLAAVLAGLGNSPIHPVDFSLLNRKVSQPRLGHAFSVHGLSGYIGWAVAPVLMTTVASLAGWRVAALSAGLIGAAALLVITLARGVLAEPAHGAGATGPAKPGGSSVAFLQSAPVWMCFAFFVVGTTAFGALQNFGPSVLRDLYSISIAAAASSLTAFMLGGAAGTFTGGFLASREEGHDRMIGWMLGGAAAAALGIASGVAPSWSVPIMMAAMGFLSGMAGPSRDMLVRRAATSQFGQSAYGRVYGFVYSGLDLGLAAAPLVFGLLMDTGQHREVLYGVALLQAMAILTALSVGQKTPPPAPAAVPSRD